ncbi:MAG: patatin-like phospholipase family protein [Cyclobacteriaceae bacterium]
MDMFTTGIVLSGGAVRGIAHLGVLKALHEQNTKIDVIAGTSIGAIIGAFYAQGYSPDEIFQFYKDKNPFKYLRPQFPDIGLLSADKLFADFATYFNSSSFEELNIPLYVTTTNLTLGQQAVFSKGKLLPILKAASSVPVIFKPEKIDDMLHADGGLLSNFPVEPLIDKCKTLIGVNVNPIEEASELNNLNSIILRSIHLSIWGNTNKNIDKVDIYIEPEKLKQYSLIDYSHMDDIYEAGLNSGREIIKKSNLLELSN